MTTNQRRDDPYHGRIRLPEAASGSVRIRHRREKAGFHASLVNLRAAILGGQLGGLVRNLEYPYATKWHELRDDDGIWMTDQPIEWQQHRECLRGAFGDVLIGGLGIGMAVRVLADRLERVARSHRPDPVGPIRKIVVVERSADVIHLVEKETRRATGLGPDRLEIVNADLFTFLKACHPDPAQPGVGGRRFDTAFYDIWRGDGLDTFMRLVLPLRDLSRGVVAGSPVCWNEDIMRGQLRNDLLPAAFLLDPGVSSMVSSRCEPLPETDGAALYVNWAVPFFRWVRDTRPNATVVFDAASVYANVYGLTGWQDTWAAYTSGQLGRA